MPNIPPYTCVVCLKSLDLETQVACLDDFKVNLSASYEVYIVVQLRPEFFYARAYNEYP